MGEWGNEKIDAICTMMLASHKYKSCVPEELKAVIRLGQRRIFRKNEIIYKEKDPVEGFYIIVSGRVEIYKYTDSGEEKIFGSTKSGDEFGSPELFEEWHIVNVRALEPVELLFISRSDFFEKIIKLESVTIAMMRVMGILVGMLQSEIVNESAESKVASYLNDLMIYHGRKIEGQVHIPRLHTNEKLSAMLRLSRETVSRTFSYFKNNGIIEIHKEYFLINNYKELENRITVTDRLYDRLKKS